LGVKTTTVIVSTVTDSSLGAEPWAEKLDPLRRERGQECPRHTMFDN
jgi:hypothetical protein